jgi:splicing factor 3A subunit 3
VYDAHLTSKKHVKATAKQAAGGDAGAAANPNGTNVPPPASHSSAKSRIRNAAYLTHLTTALIVTLAPVVNETKSNVERRFSLTAREREQEQLDQAKPPPPPPNPTGDGPAEEDEEEERIYNPLKLPLGWDGKPIPYWLYKLHGLGVEYRCEICSDHVYMGRCVVIYKHAFYR